MQSTSKTPLPEERPADPQAVFGAVVVDGIVDQVSGWFELPRGPQVGGDNGPSLVEQRGGERVLGRLRLAVEMK